MNKRIEKKINKLEENIKNFISRMEQSQKTTIIKGKEALRIQSVSQIDYWIVQYKLTEIYIQQSKEMIGQLSIARYSSEMKTSIKDLYDYMSIMTKSLRRFFGISNLNSMEKMFEKNQIKMELAKDEANELIKETTERFKDMEANNSRSVNDLQISVEEKEKITNMFKNDKVKTNFYDIYN